MLTGLFQEAQQNRHSIAGAITMASSSSRPISYSSNTPDNCLGFHPRARAALLVCGRIKRRLYYRVGNQTGVCIYIIYIYIYTYNQKFTELERAKHTQSTGAERRQTNLKTSCVAWPGYRAGYGNSRNKQHPPMHRSDNTITANL